MKMYSHHLATRPSYYREAAVRLLVLVVVGIVGLFVGIALASTVTNRCFIMPAGFVIALAGLTIAFLTNSKRVTQGIAQPATTTLRHLATGIIVFGVVVFVSAFVRFGYSDENNKEEKAIADMITLTRAAELYKLRFEEYPPDLDALVNPPDGGQRFVESQGDITDPWGQPYHYNANIPLGSSHTKPEIWCVTPEGKQIGSWMPPPGESNCR